MRADGLADESAAPPPASSTKGTEVEEVEVKLVAAALLLRTGDWRGLQADDDDEEGGIIPVGERTDANGGAPEAAVRVTAAAAAADVGRANLCPRPCPKMISSAADRIESR